MTHLILPPNTIPMLAQLLKSVIPFSLLLGLLFSGPKTQAQSSFSVEEAVKYALTNSSVAKNAALDEQSARAKVREITTIGFPQVNASYNVSNNYIIQSVIIPDGAAFGGTPGEPLALKFQPQYGGQAVLSINQLIFDGSYIVGLQAAQTYRELAMRASDISRTQVIYNVKAAYYGVLIAREKKQAFDVSLARLDSTLIEMRVQLANGFIEKLVVDRTQLQRNNVLTERDNADRAAEIALALLKFQMNYPAKESIELRDQLSQVILNNDVLNNAATDYNKVPEFKLILTQKRAAELELKNVRAGYLPSLGAQATRGALAGANSFDRVLNPSGDWYAFGAIGLSIQVPIFDSFNKRFQAQQKKINVLKVENGIQDMKRVIDLNIEQANINLQNAIASAENQNDNVSLAKEVLEISRKKYDAGVGSNLEVISAESDFRQAQTNYFAAVFSLLVAKLDLEKAKGELVR